MFSVVLAYLVLATINWSGWVDFNGWENDVVMATTDKITYTKTVTFSVSGGAKFRQDAAWTKELGGKRFS